MRTAEVIGRQRTLNEKQALALQLICEALDKTSDNSADQHLQYIGAGAARENPG